jgi:MFS family permease
MSRTRTPLVLLLACVAQFMLLVDDTITNVALPTIGRDLHFSESNLSWVVNAYLLTFGGLLLVASPEGEGRRRALAVWAGLLGLGAATGLVAGGALVQVASWRWILFINAPVAAAALVAVPRVLAPDDRADRRELPNIGGAALATTSLLVLVYSVVQTDTYAWISAWTLGGLALALVLAVAFAVSERRSEHPLLPRELLGRRLALRADLVIFLAAAGLLAMFFFQTLYLQRVLGFGPLQTGLSFLPFSGAMAIASALMGRLPERVDPRLPVVIGCALGAGGLWLMSRLTPGSSYAPDVLPALAVTGLGLGLAFVPILGLGTGDAQERDGGLASGLMTTAQRIGGAIGIAALITVATSRTTDALATGARPAYALSHGFSAAFGAEVGILVLAALTALVLLRREHRVGSAAGIDGAVATSR